jgi:hypothetical protein
MVFVVVVEAALIDDILCGNTLADATLVATCFWQLF